jgi:hypothetical protein
LTLDLKRMSATRAAEQRHRPALSANFEGNLQQLPGGNVFLGWGQQPCLAEFDKHDRLILDGRFIPATANYRAYRCPWSAAPSTPPAVTASRSGPNTIVHASWNGATNVASWRVLGGHSTNALKALASSPKHGFETAVTVGAQQYIVVQAVDTRGRTLATSPAVRTRS